MTGSSRWDRLNLDSSGRIWVMRCLSDRIHTMKCLSYWVNELKCLPLRVYRMIVLPNNFQETIHFCQYSYQEVVYWSKTWDSSLNFKYIFLAISYLPQTSLRTSSPPPSTHISPTTGLPSQLSFHKFVCISSVHDRRFLWYCRIIVIYLTIIIIQKK